MRGDCYGEIEYRGGKVLQAWRGLALITDDDANVRVRGLPCGANVRFGGFPYTVYPGRPEWSKIQTRGKPLVATAQATYVSAGEQ